MRRSIRPFLSLAAICITLTSTGCGSSETLVHFKGAPHASISKATLDHWMRAFVGADFRTSLAAQGPTGLVAEPADYRRCLNATRFVARRSMFNQLRVSQARLERICHQLERSVKAQALGFLISAQWTTAEAAQADVSVTDSEVKHQFDQTRAQRFPTERDLRKYETERRLSLADLLYQAKLSALVTKLLPRFQQRVEHAGGGERVYAKLALEHYRELIARTDCEPGYVVPGCGDYHGPPGGPISPNVLLTQLASGQ